MRPGELYCLHEIGHSSGVHGCDGCCGSIVMATEDRTRTKIIQLLEQVSQFADTAEIKRIIQILERMNHDTNSR
jgi:hypothetical protein